MSSGDAEKARDKTTQTTTDVDPANALESRPSVSSSSSNSKLQKRNKSLTKSPSVLERATSMFKKEQEKPISRVFSISSDRETNAPLKFKSNSISTSKYNVVTFLPKGLYEQFRRVANLYFLSVATISCFESISPIKPYTMWVPLTFIITLSMTKEAVEDYKRHKQDNEQNRTPIERFNGECMENKEWRDLVCGDVVRVVRDAFFPCDLIMIGSSNEERTCYVETKNLDGETNLKLKRSVDMGDGVKVISNAKLANLCRNSQRDDVMANAEDHLSGNLCTVECEHPNNSLYTFSGNLELKPPFVSEKKKIAVTPTNILLRGSQLRNTEYVYGIVIYTGHDSKVMMNASETPSKRSHVEKQMDYVVLGMLILLLSMSTISAIYCSWWVKNESPKHWYLDTANSDEPFDVNKTDIVGVFAFFTSYVLYGYLIPISLYVSLEFVKVFQAMVLLNRDRKMYHEETDTPMSARTSNLNEELGMVHTVLSDKTGTLTCNAMEFFKLSVNGVSYGEGITEIEHALIKRQGGNPPARSSKAIEPSFNFIDSRLTDGQWRTSPDREQLRSFFRILAVCQTVIPEGERTPEQVVYQAESPDELAFVVAAKRFGFFFNNRTSTTVEVLEQSVNKSEKDSVRTYEVLNLLEFNSTRKRMSVVVRSKDDNKIILMTKGADSVIYERLAVGNKGGNAAKESTQQHIDDYAACGLRTLCLAQREISSSEYEVWNKKFIKASQAMKKRDEELDAVAELIEKDLELVGATAIEDKLQMGVPRCIEQLMRAGIAVWVLTGDKQDTAINIGSACSLITPQMSLKVINVEELVKLESEGEISKEEMKTQGLEAVSKQIDDGLEIAKQCAEVDAEMGLVIDGRSLSFALSAELKDNFLKLGTSCAAVICCRVSPLQKALVTKLVKDSGKITLAIGDGANDVGMIQAAHIGVGISGQEGMQAVMASDFAFAQFRFLERLLLLHGRYSYKRIARMVCYFFYKNLAFGLTIFIYNLHAAASGQVIYNDWLMSSFNIFFVCYPVIILGLFDQDVRPDSSLKHPELYSETQWNKNFNKKSQAVWALNAIWVAIVTYWSIMKAVHSGEADHEDGHVFGLWEVGTTMYTSLVFTLNLQIGLFINYWTWIHHLTIWGSFALWWILNVVLSHTDVYYSTYSYKIFTESTVLTPKYWLGFWAVTFLCLLPYIIVSSLKRLFKPSLYELVQNEESLERGACKQCLGVTTEVDGGAGGQKFKKRATSSKSHDDSMTSNDSYSDVSVVGTTTPRRQGTLRKNISIPGSATSQRTTPLGSMEILPDVSAFPQPGTPTRLPPRTPPKQ